MKIIVTPIIVLSVCILSLNIYSNVNNTLAYKPATICSVGFNNVRPDYVSQTYIKQQIDNIFNYNYILKYKNIKDNFGYCNLIFKTIVLHNNLSLEEYTMTLTHELVHLKYFTTNERFTSFKAFQILYESKNEYFKNVALAFANNDFMGLTSYEYSCAGYIEEYLASLQI